MRRRNTSGEYRTRTAEVAGCIFIVLTMALCVPLRAHGSQGIPPVADAGFRRYAASDPVQLDGTASYDPDESGMLTYTWTQLSGPSPKVANEDTAAPTLTGFVQTDEIQECLFQLIVSDGERESLPATVSIMIVPEFGSDWFHLHNDSFDPKKPTVIYFGGGDCTYGTIEHASCPMASPEWLDRANVISFPNGYSPDAAAQGGRTYYHMGDMIIVYLSSVAVDYREPIQTVGWSTGAQPAIDVGLRLNQVYRDARYAVNRVTHLDGGCRILSSWGGSWEQYAGDVQWLLDNAVDGEQCWVDHYWGVLAGSLIPEANILAVRLSGFSHASVRDWYGSSLTDTNATRFGEGLVGGAYWSVVGPGKNLQFPPVDARHFFRWEWNQDGGGMQFCDESKWPGTLPEPITLLGPFDVGDPCGVLLTCYESENAVGYELLCGSDPYRVMDYRVVSDTPLPPTGVIREIFSEDTFWTIRARDQYGSTIYADPIALDLTDLAPLAVQNARSGKRYGLIGLAILDAEPGDTILLDPGVYEENIEVTMPLTVRSLAPGDPLIVAQTIIRGRAAKSTVTFSSSESAGSTLAGLTIQSETVGISCRDAAPTIQSCIVDGTDGIAVEFWHGHSPHLIDCMLLGQVREGGDPGLIAYWKLDETEGAFAYDSVSGKDGMLVSDPVWQPDAGVVHGALGFDGVDDCAVINDLVVNPADGPFSVLGWIKGGALGQVIVSQANGTNWLMADSSAGTLMTELLPPATRKPIPPLVSESLITDGNWHRIGFVWDGMTRALYVDDILVAEDMQSGLAACSGGLNIGCGKDMAPGTFFSGLIDDVRIYNRAVRP